MLLRAWLYDHVFLVRGPTLEHKGMGKRGVQLLLLLLEKERERERKQR